MRVDTQQNAFETFEKATHPGIAEATWEEVKQYIEIIPDMAQALHQFAKNLEDMRARLQLPPFEDHYHTELANDALVQERIQALEPDSGGPMRVDTQQNAFEAVVHAARPCFDDTTWEGEKQLVSTPDIDQSLHSFAVHPEAIAEQYHVQLANDSPAQESKALGHDPGLAPVIAGITQESSVEVPDTTRQKLKSRHNPGQGFKLTKEHIDGLGPHVPPEFVEALHTMVLVGMDAEAQALFAKARQRWCKRSRLSPRAL